MSVLLAFVAGLAVSAAAFIMPHARSKESSIDSFETFQHTLATLPVARAKKHH